MRSESCTSHIYANLRAGGAAAGGPGAGAGSAHHPRAMIVDLLAALTHVTSEKSRRPVP